MVIELLLLPPLRRQTYFAQIEHNRIKTKPAVPVDET
jgi:hypothetical protein